MAAAKAAAKGGAGATTLYKVEGGKLVRTHKQCPKCGVGVFMAEHKGRRSCGKCGYMEREK